MTKIIPRIKGRAVEIKPKQWAWEMEIHVGDCAEIITMQSPPGGIYLTRELAVANMKTHVEPVIKVICDVLGTKHDGFIDLIKNRHISTVGEL